ncbi:hypothetical protein KJ611_00330 [Patescibacteria group bacterium]|nr:hypothetical protein [Patescibacteria group bacterium]MBU1705194.1 hypothetical protein [Patescibacteria group bacterium]
MPATHFFKTNQPATRLIAQGLFWAFIVLAILMQLGWIDVVDHNQEWFLVYMLLLSALGMMGPFIIVNLIRPLRARITEQALGLMEMLAGAAMVASWIGAFGLYRDGFGYDTFVHFFASLCLVLIFGIALTVFPFFAKRVWLLLLLVVVLTLLGGLLNEMFEYAGDLLFTTMMYGEAGQPDDTLRDLIGNSVGAVIGVVVLYFVRERLNKYLG